MISYHPELNVDYGRVIQFRPRIGMSRRRPPGNAAIENAEPDYSPVPDLSKYECPESDDDEYRHRMTVNAIAAAFTSVLILAGVWIANMMAHA
jgi:hypothetical protein